MKNYFYKKLVSKTAWIWLGSTVFLILSLTNVHLSGVSEANKYAGTPNTCNCYSISPFQHYTISFAPTVPGDILTTTTQGTIDCFAWQEFIALNWPVDQAHSFGSPLDMTTVQWETYMPRNVLFQENGAPPPKWGTLVSSKYASKFKSQRLLMNNTKTKLLTFQSKFDESDTLQGFDSGEAAPFNSPSWLGAQNGTNVWYEILLNKDYYDFVVNAKYYNAAIQHDSARAGVLIKFPQGQTTSGGTNITGAIELKAAWMEVDNPKSAKWKRFKLSRATVLDGTTDSMRNTTVALVGLHILHKTQSQPSWVWATFEQIDNVQDGGKGNAGNFYNNQCKPIKLTVKNASGTKDTTVTISCTSNTSPSYYLKQGKPVSIQVSRTNPIDQTNAAIVNKNMQDSIKYYYPNSVWQYYQLVDVIWTGTQQYFDSSFQRSPLNSSIVNLFQSGSPSLKVANTTMETYVQNLNCISCHRYSSISAYAKDSVNNNIFGDFSFAIGFATAPKLALKPKARFALKN